jgi:ABC-type Fe3+ transport system permease subunit
MKRGAAASLVVLITFFTLMPSLAWASGEGGATEIVVVADTRVVHNPVLKYFANIYNSNILEFAVWCVVLTAVYGMILGFLMDWIMSKTGLDLRSRKIVEH